MVKYKIKKKDRTATLIVNIKSKYQISEREAYAISSDGIEGLLRFDTERKKSSFSFIYDLNGLVSLKKILNEPLDRSEFINIIAGILNNLKTMEGRYISSHMALYDLQYVMYEPQERKVMFICIPVQGFESGRALRELLSDICSHCQLSDEEENMTVKECADIVNHGVNLSLFDMEQFLKIQQVQPQRDSINKDYESYGNRVGGIYDPLKKHTCKTNGKKLYLIRKADGGRICVDFFPFVIGRAAGDYRITENTAVSKTHADIIFHHGQYYVRDLGSRNHTYVDGIEVAPGMEKSLVSGCTLKLANEEFGCRIE